MDDGINIKIELLFQRINPHSSIKTEKDRVLIGATLSSVTNLMTREFEIYKC